MVETSSPTLDKTFKINKIKETTDPNLNYLEINDNSAKDNLITITRIGCISGNLGNNDEFNVPREILVNDNKETQAKNNCEYVTIELLDTFYNDCIDFKHYINDILNIFRGGSKTAASSKIECFAIIVNSWKLDPPLILNERTTTSTKKTSFSEQILLLKEQVRILKLENKKLQEERRAQLNIIEILTENQDSDFRKKQGIIGQQHAPVRPSKNNKGLSSRQNTVPELQNSYSPLQVKDLPQQILVEKDSSTVLLEERNTMLGNVIRRRPNICTTEKYFQTQQQWQKSKVALGNKIYVGTLKEGTKNLIIGDSHIRRVNRDKLQNSFDKTKSFVRYFSGAKTEDLHH